MGVTSPFALPLHRMGSSSVTPVWALTAHLTFSHCWTDKPQAPDAICCHLGQCVIPPLCSGPELVSTPSPVDRTTPSTILSVSKPNQRVFSRLGGGGFTISGPRLRYPSLKTVVDTELSACLIFAELSVFCTRL